MLGFIDIQAAAKQSQQTQAVRALANEVEIIVDSAEATEKVLPIQTSLIPPTERADEAS